MSFIGLLRVMDFNLLIGFNFYGALSQIAAGQPCSPRMTIDRHADATKSILLALVPPFMYIKCYFFIDDVCLSTHYEA